MYKFDYFPLSQIRVPDMNYTGNPEEIYYNNEENVATIRCKRAWNSLVGGHKKGWVKD